MKNIIRKILIGDSEISEYSTVSINGEIQEKAYLQLDNLLIDISTTHWLLCLDPVVYGIWTTKEEEILSFENTTDCTIYFKDNEKITVAALQLTRTGKIEENSGSLFLLTLQKSRVYHINFIKTFLLYNRYYKKPQQSFDQLKAYASAYSYPRKVRVVSFAAGEYFNIFPMDLVGDISHHNRYVFGLRHTNVTLARIIESKKLLIAEVSYTCKDIIYQLGKHHSSTPLSAAELPFAFTPSKVFGFPVPEWAYSYKEINIIKTINLGSHMLLWGEPVNEVKLKAEEGHLFHIHFLHYLHQKNNGHPYQLV